MYSGILSYNLTDLPQNQSNLLLLDTGPEKAFDNLVRLANLICHTPVSFIAICDKQRLWLKAKQGVDLQEIPVYRELSEVSLFPTDLTVINDLSQRAEFKYHPLINSLNGVLFFASLKIRDVNGICVGYFCIADTFPREFSETQSESFQLLGSQLTELLNNRKRIIELSRDNSDSSANREQVGSIFQNAIASVVVVDSRGVILQWNLRSEAIFGWAEHEAVGRYLHELIIPEKQINDYLAAIVNYVSHNQESHRIFELTAATKNKGEIEIELGISHMLAGGQNHFINFISDISERKSVLRRLDEQKAFYENILNTIPADIVVFDPNHRYLFVNPGAIKDEQLRKFIVGKDDFEYFEYRKWDLDVAQLRREQFLQVVESGIAKRWEDNRVDPNGNLITHLRILFPVKDELQKVSFVIGFGIDITDRKIMEDKQEQLVKQLSAQNLQLVDFCNIVSHNLRGPLVNIAMLVRFIEESASDEERGIMIGKLNPVLANLNSTFNELVETVQVRQDVDIPYELNKLDEILRRIIVGSEVQIVTAGANIVTDFTDAPYILAPTKYLQSILYNLLNNALKYKSPLRPPEIAITTKNTGTSILLSVADNGLGIDLNRHKEKIFKIGKVFHRHPEAKGFGLFMTKTQVEAMNGQIWVESKPEVGTTFFIEFKNQNL